MLNPKDNREIQIEIPESVHADSGEINKTYIRAEQLGMLVSHYDHIDNFDSIMGFIRDDEIYAFNINDGSVLNVGIQSTSILSFESGKKREFIDPLDNLVIELRKRGIEGYGISPEAKECNDWKEIGIYKGVSQKIPFDDDKFSTLVALNFLDDTYPELRDIVRLDSSFYKKTAEEFKRVIQPNGRCIVTGGPVPDRAIEAFLKVGFEVHDLLRIKNNLLILK